MTNPVNYMVETLEDLVEMADENKLPQTILDAIYFQSDTHITVEIGITWDDDELVFMFLCWEHKGSAESVYLTKEQLYPLLPKET